MPVRLLRDGKRSFIFFEKNRDELLRRFMRMPHIGGSDSTVMTEPTCQSEPSVAWQLTRDDKLLCSLGWPQRHGCIIEMYYSIRFRVFQ